MERTRSRRRHVWSVVVSLMVGVAGIVGIWPLEASANGSIAHVPLVYLPGVSNWGTAVATGMVDIVKAEGDVHLQASGLQRLNGDLYQLWLLNSKTGDRLAVAKFNAAPDGTASVDAVVRLDGFDFDLVALSVESEPDPSPDADSRLSIAGRYPPAATPPAGVPVAGGPTAGPGTPTAGATAAGSLRALPRTGEPVEPTVFLGIGALIAGALLLYVRR